MTELEALLERYDYAISPESIALTPAEPRDSSRVLIYERKKDGVSEDVFLNIANHIPEGAVLVFNNTKVVPARLPGHISTGGKVELLCTSFGGSLVTALCERFLKDGEVIRISDAVSMSVEKKEGSVYTLALHGAQDIRPVLQELGTTPLPPYLKSSPLSEAERREKYQAIFAKSDGSIAAPTASLHFSDAVMQKLSKKGITACYVTLHVNLGTFMPLTEEHMRSGELHEEQFEIPEETIKAIQEAKKGAHAVIAVGTTALRAVESAFNGRQGSTTLFIQEGYSFKGVTGLITNFHVPKSSLMMLVSALVGREKLLTLYRRALDGGFRFYSFGDAMLIL